MKYYKDAQNKVYGYDEDAPEKYLQPGLTAITEAEKEAIVNQPQPLDTLKVEKLGEIAQAAKQFYTGGFVSTATGANVTFDSTDDDQRTLDIMYAASNSPDVVTH